MSATKHGLLAELREKGPRTRKELRAKFGPRYGLLLKALDDDGHRIRRHPSRYPRYEGDWWRVELLVEATPAPAVREEPQLALAVDACTPPRSALFGLGDAA